MKKLLVTLAAVLVSISAFAQGTVVVANRNLTTGGNVPIYLNDGTTGPGLSGGQAQLYLASGGVATTALTPVINFRTTSAAAAPFLEGPTTVTVPGVAPGSNADFILRAWVGGASYDAATQYKGESPVIHVTGLGGDKGDGSPPLTPPDISGLQTFNLQPVPEPSTIALGVLGAAALFIRRRK